MFLIFVSITVQCVGEENSKCKRKYPPGSNRTTLSVPEIFLKSLMIPKDAIKNIIGKIGDVLGKHKKESTSKKTTLGNILNQFADKFRAIFPGTLWCGDGNIAKNETDLGFFNKTDACCRTHDNCKINIEAGDTRCNLKNNGIFTRSAYSCDREFYDCLKEVHSPVSKQIQCTYFNLLRPQSFKCVCPTNTTTDNDTECNDYCKLYEWRNNPKAPLGPFCLFP